MQEVPPPGSKSIPHEFLAELWAAAHRPISGPGVSSTSFGTFILPPESEIASYSCVLFELKTSLDPETNTADAYPREWSLDNQQYETNYDADTFTVYDTTHSRRAIGYDDAGGRAGAYGWALGVNDEYAIAEVQERAKHCRGKLYGALSGASQYVDNIVPLDGGQNPVASTADTVAVNVFSVYTATAWEGDDNAVVYIIWNEVDDRFEFIDVECPSA